MKYTFKDKALAFIVIAICTCSFIFISTRMMTGVLGVCK